MDDGVERFQTNYPCCQPGSQDVVEKLVEVFSDLVSLGLIMKGGLGRWEGLKMDSIEHD